MAKDTNDPYESWGGHRCPPSSPRGGGGPGSFASSRPLEGYPVAWDGIPPPDSPVGKNLQITQIRSPSLMERLECVTDAYERALMLAPKAVLDETGCQLAEIIKGFLPGLLQMLAIVGITTVAGASVGAVIGFLFGGVGAAPGAVVGGEIGLELGAAILTWMGLGFLVVAIGKGLAELTSTLIDAISRAWHAAEYNRMLQESPSKRRPGIWRDAWGYCSA